MAVPSEKLPEKKPSNKPARMVSPFEEFERMLDNYFQRGSRNWLTPFGREWPSLASEMPKAFEGRTPKVDVIDRESEVVVRAELPGVKKKDLDVSIKNNQVSIKASTSHEDKEEKGDYYHCEISRGEFVRVIPVPSEIDAESARASFKDGILELTMPKLERSRKQKVEIE